MAHLSDGSGACPVPCPWVSCTPASWSGEESRGPTYHLPSSPRLPSAGLLAVQTVSAPAALPGSLHLALTWAPGWPCTQVLARLAFALILPLEPTHMLGSPTLFLPWKRLWPHPQGSDVGNRGSWSVGPAHQSVHWHSPEPEPEPGAGEKGRNIKGESGEQEARSPWMGCRQDEG